MIIEDWIARAWLIQIGIPAALVIVMLVYVRVARVIAQVNDKHVVLETTDKIKFAVLATWVLIYHVNIQLTYVNSETYLSEDFTPFIYIAIISSVIILYTAIVWTTKLVVSRAP